jgi:Skp family chaperone for outer membrane proteins
MTLNDRNSPGCKSTQQPFQAGLLGLALITCMTTHAASVPEVVEAADQWRVAQAESQRRVDEFGEERRSLAEEYRTVLREIEGLEAYNRQLERQLRLQGEEMAILDESIAQATTVDRQVLPLMLRMVSALEQFVALDIPFLPRERAERLQFVLEAIDRVDVTVAEKFRQVLEAYLIELEFGRTIEAYTGTVDVDGQTLEVDFLRVGRIGLYYQTLDGTQSARWDVDTKSWVKLPASDRNPIREAIRVARKLTAPNLLTLPLPTAGDAS